MKEFREPEIEIVILNEGDVIVTSCSPQYDVCAIPNAGYTE